MTPDPGRPVGLIGGIGLTEVRVYEQRPAPDGLCSGCPHVHAVTDEAYYVLRGTGWVEFHDLRHGLRRLDLAPGDYAHFPPLVMHRLVSSSGLVILGIMGNAGLAERGEARIYFGPDVDNDPQRFEELSTLPRREGLEGALRRRDAAVEAYGSLLRLWESDRPGYFTELERFFGVHCRAMAARAEEMSGLVESGPLAWARATQLRLAGLPALPDTEPLIESNHPGDESALGMCGVLRPMLNLETMP